MDRKKHTCDNCGRAFFPEDSGSSHICPRCYGRAVKPAVYRPDSLIFHGKNRAGVPFFGVEIECGSFDYREDIDQIAENVAREGILFVKEDASITCDYRISEGFEVCTHPATLEWISENLENELAPLFSYLPSLGFKADETESCGMHVHISRASFKDPQHIYRFARFFFENHTFIWEFSDRDLEDLERWAKMTAPKHLRGLAYGLGFIFDRYFACNLSNPNTLEVRIWRSTLRKDVFMRRIEFLYCLFLLTRDLDTDQSVDSDDVCRFALTHGEMFPNFAAWIGNVNRNTNQAAA